MSNKNRIYELERYKSIFGNGEKDVIVYEDFYCQENAIIFTLGHPDTDWSDNMILAMGMAVVDLMNKYQNELDDMNSEYYNILMGMGLEEEKK